jgi:3-dehydroquinate synthase
MGFNEFIKHMRRDKKNLAGKLRLIIPTAIGQSEMRDDIKESMLQQIL